MCFDLLVIFSLGFVYLFLRWLVDYCWGAVMLCCFAWYDMVGGPIYSFAFLGIICLGVRYALLLCLVCYAWVSDMLFCFAWYAMLGCPICSFALLHTLRWGTRLSLLSFSVRCVCPFYLPFVFPVSFPHLSLPLPSLV